MRAFLCEFCEKRFNRYVSERNRHKHGYCSTKCLIAFRKTPAYTFWPKIRKTRSCWLWDGAMFPNGYGALWLDKLKPRKLAHRYSWELHRGKIPPGKLILHRCDVRNCVRPSHLFVGTHHDNTHDAIAKGRMSWQRGVAR